MACHSFRSENVSCDDVLVLLHNYYCYWAIGASCATSFSTFYVTFASLLNCHYLAAPPAVPANSPRSTTVACRGSFTIASSTKGRNFAKNSAFSTAGQAFAPSS